MIKDNDLLKEFIEGFYGYGNLNSKYWFIGMEEAGGETYQEINSRLEEWKKAGKPVVLDNYEFHTNIQNAEGKNFEFLFNGGRQATWEGLIKLIMNYDGKEKINPSSVRNFQASELGRKNSNNCLLEVFPLPSPSTSKFNYSEWTNGYLKSRSNYKKSIQDIRIEKLKNLITNEKPEFVIFYSSNKEYYEYWSAISETNFKDIDPIMINEKNKLKVKIARKGKTTFAVIHHPTAFGISNNYYKEVAKEIKTVANNG